MLGVGTFPGAAESVFFHGTSVESAWSLLRGDPLSEVIAAANKIDGRPGFYLSTDPVVAEFFALRRARGAILRYTLSGDALGRLTACGSALTTIPQGRFPTFFPGMQLTVAVAAFEEFNRLLAGRAIEVASYRPAGG